MTQSEVTAKVPVLSDREMRTATALRLGWHIAELRGRLKILDPYSRPEEPDYVFQLVDERTKVEMVLGIGAVVVHAAKQLGVGNWALDELTGFDEKDATIESRLEKLGKTIIFDVDPHKRDQAWEELVKLLWYWDLKIIDSLNANSAAEGTGYQLGRAFSEIRWAPDTMFGESWMKGRTTALNGPRVAIVLRLVERLTDQLGALTGRALSVSLQAWGDLAAHEMKLISDSVSLAKLEQQGDIWHDLILRERPAESLLVTDAGTLIKHRYSFVPVLRQFLPELIAATLALGLIVVTGALLITSQGTPLWTFITGALGVVGISAAGVRARLKNAATGILGRLRDALTAELIGDVATVLPATPFVGRLRKRSRVLRVKNRPPAVRPEL